MIVVAGGQFDTNLSVLLERLEQRNLPHLALRVGPDHAPALTIDIAANTLAIDGAVLAPRAMFIRQDVFLYATADLAQAHTAALNWYSAVRGWALGRPDIRLFNRHTSLRENNKIQNLVEARKVGLRVPQTVVTTHCPEAAGDGERIVKPAAGGSYTRLLDDAAGAGTGTGAGAGTRLPYPHFVQPRLNRPEMRIYRVGAQLLAFWLSSPDLDYRTTQDVELSTAPVPAGIGGKLIALCDRLELDFAAADFMADADGALHFLEVNSQPMFAAFDRIAGGRLADAIIDQLMGPGAPAEPATSATRSGARASAEPECPVP